MRDFVLTVSVVDFFHVDPFCFYPKTVSDLQLISQNFQSWVMGRLFVIHLEGKIYSCKHCRTPLALCEDIVSKVLFLIPYLLFYYDPNGFYFSGIVTKSSIFILAWFNLSVRWVCTLMWVENIITVSVCGVTLVFVWFWNNFRGFIFWFEEVYW